MIVLIWSLIHLKQYLLFGFRIEQINIGQMILQTYQKDTRIKEEEEGTFY